MAKGIAISLAVLLVLLIGAYFIISSNKNTRITSTVPTPTLFISETPTETLPISVSPVVTERQVTVVVTPTPVKKVTQEVTPTISAMY